MGVDVCTCGSEVCTLQVCTECHNYLVSLLAAVIKLQVANFDNIYHFELSGSERARAPTDSPYTAKSSLLLSEQSVSYATDAQSHVCMVLLQV